MFKATLARSEALCPLLRNVLTCSTPLLPLALALRDLELDLIADPRGRSNRTPGSAARPQRK